MQSRLRWASALAWAPKRVRTAVVFATHVRRIRAALRRGESVVAHNRGCGPLVLRAFARLARRAGAGFHLLVLDVPAEAAVAGPHARGRVLRARTFALHRRHCAALLARARPGGGGGRARACAFWSWMCRPRRRWRASTPGAGSYARVRSPGTAATARRCWPAPGPATPPRRPPSRCWTGRPRGGCRASGSSDADRVGDHVAGGGGPAAHADHVVGARAELEGAEAPPRAAAGPLVDGDGLVAARGGDDVRGRAVVAGIGRMPDLDPVRARARDARPEPGGVAGGHRVGEAVVGAVPLGRVRGGAPGRPGGEPGVGVVHGDAEPAA